MSPRRSSRARTTQPSTSAPSQTLSSSSSTTSGRADRSTRSHHKNQSPQKSTPPRSRSSEEEDETSRPANSEPLQTRRRKREREGEEDLDRDVSRPGTRNVHGEEDDEEEEEITRCVCGNQDYPGAPVPITEQSIEVDVDQKATIKDEANLDSSMVTSDGPSDESGGLFIQCDICKVWQHGGCVGILDQSMSPDEYFCEQCRKDLHRIVIGQNGQRFSRYLPVLEASSPKPPRSTSQSKDRESKASSGNKSNRPSTGSNQTKRRSTMNSRDAAYDEEEQLRRAIEESKGEGKNSANLETSSRRGKRGRSDSEEKDHEPKRQCTASNSPSPPPGPSHHTNSQMGDSDDDAPSNKNSVGSGGKRIRGAAARNQRDKEIREKEKEKERADAAGRRKGRAERRRGDESDPSDEYPLSRTASTKGITEPSPQLPESLVSSQPTPNTPPPSNMAPLTTTSSSNSHRKTGRPARRGRVGRNQYTKDRDLHNDAIAGENGTAAPPNRSQSRDGPPLEDGPTASTHVNGNYHSNGNGQGPPIVSSDGSKPSRPRYMHPQRTTMNDMKRRVAAILEFISRTQVEMAGEHTPPAGGGVASSMTTAAASVLRGIGEALPGYLMANGTGPGGDERDFGEMTSLEMMDVLTRKLVLWQKEYGKYGEK